MEFIKILFLSIWMIMSWWEIGTGIDAKYSIPDILSGIASAIMCGLAIKIILF